MLQLDIFAPLYLYLAQCIGDASYYDMNAGEITTGNEQFQLYKFVEHLHN